MPKCTGERIEFGRLGRRVIEANFDGGDISSDGGLLLLRQVDERIGLTRAVAAVLEDARDPERITHPLRDLVVQRVYGLCAGYEDLNDHDRLRQDLLLRTAVGRVDALASSPTLCRLENRATRAQVVALNRVLVEQFIAQHHTPPHELILDVDASDVPLHGDQELTQFHGYYDHYCYLPLYVFCGQALLTCLLRPSRIDGAQHASAVIKLLITRLRAAWPNTRFIVRGDSGFCRQRLIRWCERQAVGYVIGVARNARLQARVADDEEQLRVAFEATPASSNGTSASCAMRPTAGTSSGGSSRAWDTVPKASTRASWSPISKARRPISTTVSTASAAKPRTASRKRSLICSARAPAATRSPPTGCACCSPRSPTRSCNGCARWRSRARNSPAPARPRSA